MVARRRNYSSTDFLVFPWCENGSSFYTDREAEVEKWNGLLAVPKWVREWRKADLCYLRLNRSGYHCLSQTDMKCSSKASSFWSLRWSYGWKMPSHWCVCGQGAVCSLHRLHMWLMPPHVLWCCFPILYSSRSSLVPSPRLLISVSGNSFVFCSPEYWRRKVPHLLPYGRTSSQLPPSFSSPHRHFGKLPLSSPVPESLIFCTKQRAWSVCAFLPHLFFLSGGWITQGICGRKGRAVLGVLLCWEMLTATVPGLWWKDNYRPDWWLLDALTKCQSFMCPALPPSHFLQDQKGTAYGCALKNFS